MQRMCQVLEVSELVEQACEIAVGTKAFAMTMQSWKSSLARSKASELIDTRIRLVGRLDSSTLRMKSG